MKPPKEKARELVDKYYKEIKYMERAIQCALIAVDVILNFLKESENENKYWIEYWYKVKEAL
jgi:hypothetical protein